MRTRKNVHALQWVKAILILLLLYGLAKVKFILEFSWILFLQVSM